MHVPLCATGVFTPFQVEELRKANLAKIICDNADDIQQVPRDVFVLQNVSEFVSCSEIEDVNLNAWKECEGEGWEEDVRGGSSNGYLLPCEVFKHAQRDGGGWETDHRQPEWAMSCTEYTLCVMVTMVAGAITVLLSNVLSD